MILNKAKYYGEINNGIINCNIPWDTFAGKKIMITGASGMIGSYIMDMLIACNEKYGINTKIYALGRNGENIKKRLTQERISEFVHVVVQDIREPIKQLEEMDYIIHAASNTHPLEYAKKPVETITTNVIGLNNVFEYARLQKQCRVVVLSSVEIYGENRGDVDSFDEDYCGYINANTLRAGYPESKRVSETLAQAYHSQYDVDSVIVRLSRVYGAGVEEDDSKAITQFIRNACNKEDIVLKSDGSTQYSYTYIADAASAILYIMSMGKAGEVYNVVGKDSDWKLKEIAEYLADISGVGVIYDIPDKTEMQGYSTATKAILDGSRLTQLGWRSQYSMNEGLQQTLAQLGNV